MQVSSALDKGENAVEALAEVVPELADAMALSLPCREMCQAVVNSCSCGKERTFGDILQAVQANRRTVGSISICLCHLRYF